MSEDVIELGFEGLDKFADKVYPGVHDRVGHALSKRKKRHVKDSRVGTSPPDDRDIESSDGEQENSNPGPARRREGDVRRYQEDDGPRDMRRRSNSAVDDRCAYYPPVPYFNARPAIPATNAAAPYAGAYGAQVALAPPPRAPVPPVSAMHPSQADNYFPEDRGRPDTQRRPYAPLRRASSYSPPRRRHHQRRSRSPAGNGLATVVGALAGGLAGNRINKGDKLTTVASAVIGAIGAREADKQWDRRREKDSGDDDWHRR